MAIHQSKYIIVVESEDPALFAAELATLEGAGCRHLNDRGVYYSSGKHVAYYFDPRHDSGEGLEDVAPLDAPTSEEVAAMSVAAVRPAEGMEGMYG